MARTTERSLRPPQVGPSSSFIDAAAPSPGLPWATRTATLLALALPMGAAHGGGGAIWPAGSTQFVISDLTIADSLVIEPGVTVFVNSGVEIRVASGGTLIVDGTADQPVQFGPNSSARWDGLTFAPGSSGSIEHATILFTSSVGLSIDGASPVVQHCTVQDVAGVAPGGAARGIRVTGASAQPVLVDCLVQQVVGAVGAAGTSTGAAGNGPDGGDGTFFAPNADNGGPGGTGGTGGTGTAGGLAIGIAIEADARPSLASNRVREIVGGAGGTGGSGGAGGDGGDGGEGANGIFAGSSGNGGKGGAGGKGGTGGVGGAAIGLRVDSFEAALEVHQLLIVEVQAGGGGKGGIGGLGGDGGSGGDGLNLIPAFANTDGGDGGDGGAGGGQGNGGSGGVARAVEILGEEATLALSQVTMAQISGGLGGSTGFANFGGWGGPGGDAFDPAEPGADGDDGPTGGAGSPGAAGNREGLAASSDVDVVLRNSIVAFGGDPAGTALAASSGAAIEAAHCCLSGHASALQGQVALGAGILLADPQFVAADQGDYTLAAGSACIDAGDAIVVAYRRDAHAWSGAVVSFEARAFDEFAPGVAGATACLSGDGAAAVLTLEGGTVTVTALDAGGVAQCAIVDAATPSQVSDASLTDGSVRLRLDFDPPIWAFYGYLGSLTMGDHGEMAIYSSNALVDVVAGEPSPFNVLASGFGVLRTAPIDRIDVTTGVDQASVLGAFVGLASGEPSLGSVEIPGYVGPAGSVVALDFALAFIDVGMGFDMAGGARVVDGDGDGDAVIDIGAMEFQGGEVVECPADFDGDGEVGGADLGALLSGWGVAGQADLSGDGLIDGVDLGLMLAAWGPCPR